MSELEAMEAAESEIQDLKRRIRELETSCEGWRVAFEHERRRTLEANRAIAAANARLARAVAAYRKKRPTGRLPFYLRAINDAQPTTEKE